MSKLPQPLTVGTYRTREGGLAIIQDTHTTGDPVRQLAMRAQEDEGWRPMYVTPTGRVSPHGNHYHDLVEKLSDEFWWDGEPKPKLADYLGQKMRMPFWPMNRYFVPTCEGPDYTGIIEDAPVPVFVGMHHESGEASPDWFADTGEWLPCEPAPETEIVPEVGKWYRWGNKHGARTTGRLQICAASDTEYKVVHGGGGVSYLGKAEWAPVAELKITFEEVAK